MASVRQIAQMPLGLRSRTRKRLEDIALLVADVTIQDVTRVDTQVLDKLALALVQCTTEVAAKRATCKLRDERDGPCTKRRFTDYGIISYRLC